MTAVQISPPGEVEVALAELDDVLDRLLRAAATTPEPARVLPQVERARRRLDAVRLRLLGSTRLAGAAAAQGASSAASWLATTTRSSRPECARETALAEALETRDTAADQTSPSRRALEAGEISVAHARVVAAALAALPQRLTQTQRAACEARLVADASRYDPDQLRRHARRVLAEVEPDPVVVDAHEDAQVLTEEDAAYAAARLTLHDHGDGTVSGHFRLPRLQADILRKALDALTSPRRSREERREVGHDLAHQRGLALASLLERLPVDHLHGTAATQVIVRMDHDVLLGAVRSAGLDTGHSLSAGEARRLVCGSALLPAVLGRTLGGASRVLDLGRLSRLFTDAQRIAVHTVHDTCAATGCDRPVAWCELHHRTPWSHGGATDLADAVPLCGWHHRRIHDPRYHHTYRPDGTLDLRRRC